MDKKDIGLRVTAGLAAAGLTLAGVHTLLDRQDTKSVNASQPTPADTPTPRPEATSTSVPKELGKTATLEEMVASLQELRNETLIPVASLPVSIEITDSTSVFFHEVPADKYSKDMPITREYTVGELKEITTALGLVKAKPYLARNLPEEIHFSLVKDIPGTYHDSNNLSGLTVKLNHPAKGEGAIIGILWTGNKTTYADTFMPELNGIPEDTQVLKGEATLVHELTHAVALKQQFGNGWSDIIQQYKLHGTKHSDSLEEDAANSLAMQLILEAYNQNGSESELWDNLLPSPIDIQADSLPTPNN